MYDWNLTEYDILEKTDEEYLNYCKDNYNDCKKSALQCLFSSVLNLICGLYAMYCNYRFFIPINFVLCGCMFFMVIYSYIESKRWKVEVERFKKERTCHDSDNN